MNSKLVTKVNTYNEKIKQIIGVLEIKTPLTCTSKQIKSIKIVEVTLLDLPQREKILLLKIQVLGAAQRAPEKIVREIKESVSQ